MADTTYVDGVTLLTADTMNDLNRLHYTILGDPANAASVLTALGAADISPSQITANQNDYNPTGLSTATVLRLSTDASRDLTGLSGGADGRVIDIHNVGSNALVLKDESASSTAANRFALNGDITLSADQAVSLWYDGTSSRWRCVAQPYAASTGLSLAASAFSVSLSTLTNSLSGDVALNNTGTFFDGPTVAQGTSGTWFASGQVTLKDNGAAVNYEVKLWDGTTVIDSAKVNTDSAGRLVVVHLSGRLASPAGNIRISVRNITATTGAIFANESGASKDSTLTVVRIA